MEITQEDAGASDKCYACAIDHEFGNTYTVAQPAYIAFLAMNA